MQEESWQWRIDLSKEKTQIKKESSVWFLIKLWAAAAEDFFFFFLINVGPAVLDSLVVATFELPSKTQMVHELLFTAFLVFHIATNTWTVFL